MKKINASMLLITIFLLTAISLSANAATVLVTNLDQPTKATTVIPIDQGWAAQSFATDGSSYTLLSLDVLLGNQVDSPTITAELHAGGLTTVGALLDTFTVPAISAGSPALVTLTPSSPVTLDPGSYYWLVLGSTGAGSFGWSYATGNITTGPGSLGNYAYSSDLGTTWGSFNSDDPYLLRVEVAPVPLPAAAWLFGSALPALVVMGRRKRQEIIA